MPTPHDLSRRSLLGAAAATLAGLDSPAAHAQGVRGLFGSSRTLPDLDGAVAWLNSAPLRPVDLLGKVVLIQFWTFTCVNWLRTAPYARAWSAKYASAGLMVIGVHTPEFSFEGELENVRRASARLDIRYPVAVDSMRRVWRAFANGAWPATYLVDARGMIRYQHDGEGAYEQTERRIQDLLAESGVTEVPAGLVHAMGSGVEAAADWKNLRSGETYTGYAQAERFRSPGGMAHDGRRNYELPRSLPSNGWAASGEWMFASEAARSDAPGARIAYRFHARDVNLVMGARHHDQPIAFRISIDGKAPASEHGSDVDARGLGELRERRLYQLVRQAADIRDRDFQIEFMQPGAEVYAFTFG